MPNSESVGKKIVEALKKQADVLETQEDLSFESAPVSNPLNNDALFAESTEEDFSNDIFAEAPKKVSNTSNFFDDDNDPFFTDTKSIQDEPVDPSNETFEMPANITVLKKLISQLPSGVSRHTGAQIIKQTMEALGISMKSVLQDAQQVQESLKVSARECQSSIQEYKKQILLLEKQSQNYQKQYSALNDLISLFIQTTR